MKSIVFLALIGSSEAVQIDGINAEKMHNMNSEDGTTNWRKPWPQGIDNGDGDAETLEMFNRPQAKAPHGSEIESYPWQYDKDVIETGKSIDTSEESVQGNLTFDSVAVHRGKNWVFENNAIEQKNMSDRQEHAPKEGTYLGVRFIGQNI